MRLFFKFQIQYRISRVLIYVGLFIMPTSAYKTELLKVLYDLKCKVERKVHG
jgi:hypothetical protein